MSAENKQKQSMQRTYASGLTVRKSPIDGLGCFATVFYPMGRWVAIYAGERITQAEGGRRLRRQRKKRISAVDSNWSIDGSVGGNGTEYINHSCNPNCISMVVDEQINIYSLHEIVAGEELTVGYFDAFDHKSRSCGCRSDRCEGRSAVIHQSSILNKSGLAK